MSRHFLLNLVNRSANSPTIPQARPYLWPVFKPPSPMVPAMGTPPAAPMSQGRMQTMQESQFSPFRAAPKQPLSIASNSVESQPITSATFSPPVLPPGQTSLVKTKPPVLTPAEPSFDSLVHSTQSIQAQDPINRGPLIRTDHSEEETASSPKLSPPGYHDSAAQKNDNTRVKPVFQPALTAIQNKPSVIRPGMSLSFIQNTPNVLLAPSAIENVTTAEAHQPQEPEIPKIAMPEKQTPVLEAQRIPVATETIREIHLPVYPDIPQETDTSIPGEKHPSKLTALSPKTFMEPLPAAKTSAHPVQAKASAPLRIEHVAPVSRQQTQMERKLSGPFSVEHVTPAPEQQPHLERKSAGPFSFEHVMPAPEEQTPLRAQHARSHDTAPIQISIGTIDLHVNSPEPGRYQTPNRRKPPQGFDAFRHRRSYSGWEV